MRNSALCSGRPARCASLFRYCFASPDTGGRRAGCSYPFRRTGAGSMASETVIIGLVARGDKMPQLVQQRLRIAPLELFLRFVVDEQQPDRVSGLARLASPAP